MAADVSAVVNGMIVEILLSNSLYFLDGTTTTSPGYKLMFLAVIDPLFVKLILATCTFSPTCLNTFM